MDWKTLRAYLTGSVDQTLLLRNEYLVTENRILRNYHSRLASQAGRPVLPCARARTYREDSA
jgi:hypothetical protein